MFILYAKTYNRITNWQINKLLISRYEVRSNSKILIDVYLFIMISLEKIGPGGTNNLYVMSPRRSF